MSVLVDLNYWIGLQWFKLDCLLIVTNLFFIIKFIL